MPDKKTIAICLSLILLLPTMSYGQDQTVTMKQYVDMQVELNRKLAEQGIESNRLFFLAQVQNINDNVGKAYLVYDKRLEGMNEFRQTLQDSNRNYVTWQSLLGFIVGASGLFWGYSKNQREKQDAERKSSGQNIKSGDTVEVKK